MSDLLPKVCNVEHSLSSSTIGNSDGGGCVSVLEMVSVTLSIDSSATPVHHTLLAVMDACMRARMHVRVHLRRRTR
jgi:hypothetical protein